MRNRFISEHPYISLCAVVWVVCGIVSVFLKSETPLETATGATVLIGIGYQYFWRD
jgi:hypothetical protein